MNPRRSAIGLIAVLVLLLPLGTASARSIRAGHHPVNQVRPAISGSVVVGNRLAALKGTWSGRPTGFRYQWYDCGSTGGSCVRVRGATARTFLLKRRDLGSRVRVVLEASNKYGTGAARSLATQTVEASQAGSGGAPVNLSVPIVTGLAVVGQHLNTSNGAWSGNPTRFRYQWYDCDSAGANCVAAQRGTHQTYLLSNRDLGHRVCARVTASNSYGASDAWSWRTAEDSVYCYDIHATILHLLGIDHERLTVRHDGTDRRLTDVHGRVIEDVLA